MKCILFVLVRAIVVAVATVVVVVVVVVVVFVVVPKQVFRLRLEFLFARTK